MHIPTVQRMAEPPRPAPEATGPAAAARLEAVRAPLAGLVAAGTLLSLLTLGLYRFWYRTRLRRYYWGNTRLLGDAFDYTGTGRELLIGFLIALAIILPLNIGVTLLGIFGGAILGPILASALGFVIIPAVVQIALYRARRYRLTRTRWRGIRFRQSGTGTRYLLATIKWLIVTLLTFGIAFPRLRAAQERYRIENTWFGSAQGAFKVEIGGVMKPWLFVWCMGVIAIVALALIPLFAAAPENWGGAIVAGLVGVLVPLSLPFAWVHYRVREFRLFTAATHLGPLGFRSDLRTRRVIGIWLRYYLALALLLIALAGLAFWAAGGLAGLAGMRMEEAPPVLQFLPLLLIAGFVLLSAILTELLLRRPLWAATIASVEVLNAEALPEILQGAEQASLGVGEAFDVGFDFPG